jgi:hypothetical protein
MALAVVVAGTRSGQREGLALDFHLRSRSRYRHHRLRPGAGPGDDAAKYYVAVRPQRLVVRPGRDGERNGGDGDDSCDGDGAGHAPIV